MKLKEKGVFSISIFVLKIVGVSFQTNKGIFCKILPFLMRCVGIFSTSSMTVLSSFTLFYSTKGEISDQLLHVALSFVSLMQYFMVLNNRNFFQSMRQIEKLYISQGKLRIRKRIKLQCWISIALGLSFGTLLDIYLLKTDKQYQRIKLCGMDNGYQLRFFEVLYSLWHVFTFMSTTAIVAVYCTACASLEEAFNAIYNSDLRQDASNALWRHNMIIRALSRANLGIGSPTFPCFVLMVGVLFHASYSLVFLSQKRDNMVLVGSAPLMLYLFLIMIRDAEKVEAASRKIRVYALNSPLKRSEEMLPFLSKVINFNATITLGNIVTVSKKLAFMSLGFVSTNVYVVGTFHSR